MKKNVVRRWLLCICCFAGIASESMAQQRRTDTIPFSLETGLLVFKGKLNGHAIDFLFDTGAGMAVATAGIRDSAELKSSRKEVQAHDANQQTKRLQSVVAETLQVGSFDFKNIRCVMADMPLLRCMQLFVLSADVIRQLNWQIDFERRQLYVSQAAFPVEEGMITCPVRYVKERPCVNGAIIGLPVQDVLIDMGYKNVCTFPVAAEKGTQLLTRYQESGGQVQYSLAASMGIMGTPRPDTVATVRFQELQLGGHTFYQVPATGKKNTTLKLGVRFFSTFCTRMILNHAQSNYYLLPVPENKRSTWEGAEMVTVGLKESQLVITGKALEGTGHTFELDEVVSAVNGKTAADFSGECDFFRWYNYVRKDLTIQRTNGQQVQITKIKLP
ncbi:aspartyl protease family protein [Chitinophaga nivalis]|uniref:Aspartyl protease family protein n=1 Tax=Chitinophaga nivalis TaxID=2991709 RepID=A0ABT3IMS4_9BACT|nr:aspartyl protease family protein [Chitinophaga nivalis]MCW3465056.1 aspartyl protease family protein [Chitinophaga nivalis]MCW3485252.1 aspartyl protease family protein [Chitinophaga nivalis]